MSWLPMKHVRVEEVYAYRIAYEKQINLNHGLGKHKVRYSNED